MTRRRFITEAATGVLIAAALVAAGCGPSAPSVATSPEAELADQKKIQELSKQGYDFAEIRSIMKGEQVKPRAKRKVSSSRR
jgi:hypothetical protein